jgi:hypothetical protein
MRTEAEVGQAADRGNRNTSQKIRKHLTSSSFISGVIIGLASALALAANPQPQPKTTFKHQRPTMATFFQEPYLPSTGGGSS